MESQNGSGWKDLEDHPIPAPWDTFHSPSLLQAPTSLALNCSRDGESIAQGIIELLSAVQTLHGLLGNKNAFKSFVFRNKKNALRILFFLPELFCTEDVQQLPAVAHSSLQSVALPKETRRSGAGNAQSDMLQD